MRFDKKLKWSILIGYLGLIFLFAVASLYFFLPLSALSENNPFRIGFALGVLISFLLSIFLLAAFVIELIEIATSGKDGFSKSLWVIGLFIMPLLVMPAYYLWGRHDLIE